MSFSSLAKKMRVTLDALNLACSPSFLPQRRLGPSWGAFVARASGHYIDLSNWIPAFAGKALGDLARAPCRQTRCSMRQSANGSRTRIVSSRSGLVETKATGQRISSSIRRIYLIA